MPSRQRCLWAGAAALAALAVLACTPRAAAQPSETPAAVVEDQPSAAASTEALATRTPEPTAAPSTAPSISAAPSQVTTVRQDVVVEPTARPIVQPTIAATSVPSPAVAASVIPSPAVAEPVVPSPAVVAAVVPSPTLTTVIPTADVVIAPDGTATLSVRTTPRVLCTVVVSGVGHVPGLDAKQSDTTGVVTWTWSVAIGDASFTHGARVECTATGQPLRTDGTVTDTKTGVTDPKIETTDAKPDLRAPRTPRTGLQGRESGDDPTTLETHRPTPGLDRGARAPEGLSRANGG